MSSESDDELFILPSKGYSIVDAGAEWCSPCKSIAPFFESLKDKYPNLKFLKCDIDENREFAIKYNISSIPAFILFKDGLEVDRLVGANRTKLEAMVSALN